MVEVDVGGGFHVDVVDGDVVLVNVGGDVDEDAAGRDGDMHEGALTLDKPGNEQTNEGE